LENLVIVDGDFNGDVTILFNATKLDIFGTPLPWRGQGVIPADAT